MNPNFKSAFATMLTRTGKLDMSNRKPYRTAAQKRVARDMAFVHEGRHISNAPRSYHPTVR